MRLTLPAILALVCGISPLVHAQPAQDFYRNKQLRLITGHQVGNDYDVGARLLARYLPKHIPGQPGIIVQNMVAAASVAAVNYVYGVAPRDGTVIGTFSRNIPSQKLMGRPTSKPIRAASTGSALPHSRDASARSRHTAPVQTIEELFTKELIVGGAGAGSAPSILSTVFNHVLGTKFKLVEGYKGTQDALLAIERGELQGVCASYGQFRAYAHLFNEGKLKFLLRAEEAVMPDIPNVPSIYDYTKTEEQRQFMRFVFASTEFGRPYIFGPDVPKDRVELMRTAFAETLKDPELIAEADKIKLDMSFRPPGDLERLVAKLYATPPEVIEAAKRLVPNIQ